ncbi:MAG: hypothetical protein HQM10_22675 [Candidatus Riflebacteria bacterium]|nr:hypothetical protein [Candidatus Riflebacteria bacterium]
MNIGNNNALYAGYQMMNNLVEPRVNSQVKQPSGAENVGQQEAPQRVKAPERRPAPEVDSTAATSKLSDLPSAMTEMIKAENITAAGAKLTKVKNQMLGSIIDIKA